IMIYRFVTAGGTQITAPTGAPHITEPVWKIPLSGMRTDRGALSEGLSIEIATYFVIRARNLHGLIIPHDEYQAPHLQVLMEFDSPKDPTCAIGFEKAFIQHLDRSATRLSFSWEKQDAQNIVSRPLGSCVRVVSRDYPSVSNGARLVKLDEETGRIVQDSIKGIQVIDTAFLFIDREINPRVCLTS
ncbi:hypothetical protein BYT27DRAFT_7106757, partial [Phlegmacium glaucopus]